MNQLKGLSAEFLNATLNNYSGLPERVRPTRWAAKALLARVYLYRKDYVNAELQSSEVISDTVLFRAN